LATQKLLSTKLVRRSCAISCAGFRWNSRCEDDSFAAFPNLSFSDLSSQFSVLSSQFRLLLHVSLRKTPKISTLRSYRFRCWELYRAANNLALILDFWAFKTKLDPTMIANMSRLSWKINVFCFSLICAKKKGLVRVFLCIFSSFSGKV